MALAQTRHRKRSMKNEEYWKQRQVQDSFGYFEKAEKTADEIVIIYLKSSAYLESQAEQIFEKYRTRYGLTETEARELMNTMQEKDSLEELLQKLKSGERTEKKEQLLQQLEAPAYRVRIERLEELQNQLDMIMQSVYRQELAISREFYTDVAKESYYRGIFRIQQRVGVVTSFAHLSGKTIDQVLNSKWSGKNYSERIWGNTQELAKELKEELLISLVTGRTERETANIITRKFESGASEARRLVRTECNFVTTELRFKGYEEHGITKYRFLATLDLKTSKICRSLDGKVFLVSERKEGKNCPPMHPWCRSTTTGELSNDLMEGLKRSAIDPKTGQAIKVPYNMTYEEWYKKYVANNPEALAEEKAIKNRASDKKQYENYRKILGDDTPESFEKFQKMKYNEPETWEELKSLKRYLENNPGSTRADYEIYKDLKETGMKGEISLKPKIPDISKPSFDEKHINQERQHNVTEAEAKSYIQNAVFSTAKWKGKFTNYYSDKGATFVDNETQHIRTAFKREQYDKAATAAMEVIKRGQS